MLYALLLLSIILLVLLLVAQFRLWAFRRELRRLTKETDKRQDPEYGQPLKVDYFDRDIVNLAVAADKHIEIQRELAIAFERRERQLSHVISGISHDFRTPLTASIGYLQMVERSASLTEKEREYIEIAIRKTQYLKSLSDEFFELNCLTQNAQETETELLNLSNLLTECLLSQHEWIAARGIEPDIRIEEGILVQSNRQMLTRILENLFSNASKYAERTLRISLNTEDSRAVLTLSNHLTDSADLQMSQIFEPFSRGKSRTAEGSGLGLYVVRTLCESLGYTVSASDENHEFTITITTERT